MPDVHVAQPHVLRGELLPGGLRSLRDPPAELFARGTWPGGSCVAIVGARAATAYGRAVADRLAGDLAAMGMVIVSGLARGIDAAAHEGALRVGGATVAVLPGSLDVITPPSHADLASRIAATGALVAEWGSGVHVTRGLFLRRNRLIAGLARATVVVEAAERSGALSTAAIANQLGRPVLAVPGDIDRPSSRGCHALLRAGARLCEGAQDVLEAIGREALITPGGFPDPASPPGHAVNSPTGTPAAGEAVARRIDAAPAAGATDAAKVATVLDHEPRELDGIARRAGIGPERALAVLLELQWSGVAVTHPGPRWSSGRGARAEHAGGAAFLT